MIQLVATMPSYLADFVLAVFAFIDRAYGKYPIVTGGVVFAVAVFAALVAVWVPRIRAEQEARENA
jgi:hypothetical protein